MLPEIDQPHTVRQLATHEHLGGARNDYLPPMGGGHQAGAPIDRQACIARVIYDHGLVGV